MTRIDEVAGKMRDRTTEELTTIWVKNDHDEWTDDAFEAIRIVLTERGVSPPPQLPTDADPAFWKSTWTAWRSGFLSAISPVYAQEAAKDFSTFMKTSLDMKNPLNRQFFIAHPPRPSEFLITPLANSTASVLTSQRLWFRPDSQKDYVVFDLADITDFRVNSGFNSHSVTVQLKDTQPIVYNGVPNIPAAQVVRFVIERCTRTEGWNRKMASTQETAPGQQQHVRGVKCPRCGGQVVKRKQKSIAEGGIFWQFGLIGTMFHYAFAGYMCVECGEIPTAEFPSEVRSAIVTKRLLLVVGAIMIFFVVVVLIGPGK